MEVCVNPHISTIVDTLHRLLRTVYVDSAKLNRQYGVTQPQGGVLRRLRENGPTSSAQLSRMLHVTPSNMTGLIDRLERKALVQRIKKPGDRRVSMIRLTEAGEALSRKLPDPLETKLAEKLSGFAPDHVEKLSSAMSELLRLISPAESDMGEIKLFDACSEVREVFDGPFSDT